MRRNILLTDVLIAVVLAALVLILSPGVAVAAILGVLVVVVCMVSLVVQNRRAHRRVQTVTRGRRDQRVRTVKKSRL